MLPSTVLEYGLIPPMAFGLTEETVDEGRNLITITISDARRLMTRAGISPMVPMTADYESALAKITLRLTPRPPRSRRLTPRRLWLKPRRP